MRYFSLFYFLQCDRPIVLSPRKFESNAKGLELKRARQLRHISMRSLMFVSRQIRIFPPFLRTMSWLLKSYRTLSNFSSFLYFRFQKGKQGINVTFHRERMAKVHINDVTVCENPSPFLSNFQFQITFECTEELDEGLLHWISLTLFG